MGTLSNFPIALRALRRQPGFFLAAMATLALGLGGTTALFGLLYAQRFGPLPYPQSSHLVDLDLAPVGGGAACRVSSFDVAQWRQGCSGFESLVAYRGVNRQVDLGEEAVTLPVGEVDAGLLETLGCRPVLGRFHRPEDAQRGRPLQVVLGWRFWKERLGGDPGVLGRTVTIRERPHLVVGVAPDGVVFPDTFLERAPDLFVLNQDPEGKPEVRAARYLRALGRLRSGVTAAKGLAQVQAVQDQLARQFPDTHAGLVVRIRPLREALYGTRPAHLALLLAASGLLLLLACLNVAGLFLARGLAKTRETALRAALGASGLAPVAPFLAEGILVAAGGTLGGGLLAALLLRILPRLVEEASALPGAPPAGLGPVPMLLLGALAFLTCVACACTPLWHLRRLALAVRLREGGPGAGGGRNLAKGGLLASEVAVTVLLLVGSSLLLRSLGRVVLRPLGYRTRDVYLFNLSLPGNFARDPGLRAFHRGLVERLRALPGVEAVGVADQGTVFRSQDGARFTLDAGAPGAGSPRVPTLCVDPGYFTTVGVPLRRGRDVQWTDGPDAPPVVLVNEAFVRCYLPGREPLGTRILTSDLDRPAQVVGVVADARFGGPEADLDPLIIYSIQQFTNGACLVHVRGPVGARDLVPGIRGVLRGLSTGNRPVSLARLEDLLDGALAERRNTLALLGGFTVLALLLASVGVYGMAAYSTAQRRREIAVRVALGGARWRVMVGVLRRELAWVGGGALAGLAGSVAGGGLLRAHLADVSAQDPLALGASLAGLALAAGLACLVPALRALRVPPAESLRTESF
jgi:predicted permease